MTTKQLDSLITGGRKRRSMKRRSMKRRSMKRKISRKGRKATRRNKRRSNNGGFVGGIIEQAIVPFGLFALQKKMQNRKIIKKSKVSKKRKN
jgi:hypothetical protein